LPKKLEISAVLKAQDKASTPLRRAAAKIRRSMGRTMRSVGGAVADVGAKITGLVAKAGVLGTGAAIGGITAWTKSYVDAGDELNKFSRTIGLSAQRLQEFEFIGGRQGVTAKELRMAFQKLAMGMGRARAGSGELAESLKKVDKGLLRQVKSAKNTEQAIDIVLGAMAKETDAFKRAAIAQAAFGESGVKLARISELGAEGIEKLAKEARESGAVMSGKALKQTEQMSNAIQRLKEQFKATTNTVMSQLLPVLEPLIRRFGEWLKVAGNQEKIARYGKDFVKAVVDGVPKVVSWVREAIGTVSKFIDDIGGLKTVAIALGVALVGPVLANLVRFGATAMTALGPVGVMLTTLIALQDKLKSQKEVPVQQAIPSLKMVGGEKSVIKVPEFNLEKAKEQEQRQGKPLGLFQKFAMGAPAAIPSQPAAKPGEMKGTVDVNVRVDGGTVTSTVAKGSPRLAVSGKAKGQRKAAQ
jgi:hypothetical protein